MGDFFGSLISGLGSLAGGLIGSSTSEDVADKNIKMQEEFAQNGISWKVADAKRAGINPLYALGAPTSSFENVTGSDALGEGVKSAGQDLGRAAMASADKPTKMDVLKEHLLETQIKGAEADIVHQQLINSSLARKFATAEAGTGSPGDSLPLPRSDPRYTEKVEPMTTRFRDPGGNVVYAPSDAFTKSTFAMDPMGPVWASRIEAQNVDTSWPIRSDVLRNLSPGFPSATEVAP